MENAIKRKVNRIGLAGQIISIILIILMAVACFGCLAGGIGLLIIPDDSVKIGATTQMDASVDKELLGSFFDKIPEDMNDIDAELSVNGTEFETLKMEKTDNTLLFSGLSARVDFNVKKLASAAFAGVAYCAALLVVFVFLKRLSDGFRRCDTPFSDDVIHRVTVFAWVLVGGAVAMSVAESIANSMLNRSLDLSFSLNPSGISSGLSVSFSFAPILISLLVLFLTIIFRYGAQLQKQSDETL